VKTGRDRDSSVDRLLQRSLAGRDSSGAGACDECPDAETLAAWVDGGLSKHEVALMEAHASDCARCQAFLAAVLQTAPDLSPSASQESWWRGLGLRWLVPLAAGAAAIILWVAVPSDERPDLPEQASAQLPNASPAPPPPEVGADRFNAPAVRLEQPGAANEKRAAKPEDSAPSFAGAERDQQKQDAASAPPPAGEPVDTLSARASAAPPAAGAAQSQTATNETGALSRVESSAERGRRGDLIVTPIEIMSPDPAVRWRIGGAGSVEHTTNGGTTWEAVRTGVSADLTAGASPSRLVCWLVGRAGTVLLTTDGRSWRRVPFPETADLAAVQAANAQAATITTADGRTFRTTDGGLTWN
jgi:hypothetical protein